MAQPSVALCYIRQSFTRDENDKASPERQRACIEAKVKAEGWTAEWYEDADGHKSGRFVKNRPGWLALEARIGDPDVVAIIAYDLARLHRKGWRIGDLLDRITRHEVRLVFAAPGYEMDLSSFNGRMLAQISAMLDEAYAEDVSRRTKASIAYLRRQGKSVGPPPFGTTRNSDGFLEPSTEGAWVLPDGQAVAGSEDEPPQSDAQWRSYYECAHYILRIYAQDGIGADAIAYRLNLQSWPFRDRKGHPRPVTRDDIRRVLANWPEYGGAVPDQKAKDRPAYADDVDSVRLNEDRAVFPLDL
ncbi:MAG: recombinase family protein, partial [Chloroflexi bacterium]|nr:recombinase family protein [Chloroflexota bacterium]